MMSRLGLNLPNLISLARLLMVPLTIWLIVAGSYGIAFWILVAAGVSDALDGFIAKRFDRRTRLGALLDPVADKAMLVSVYVALGVAHQLWAWLVILVVFRDVMIVGGFLLDPFVVGRLMPIAEKLVYWHSLPLYERFFWKAEFSRILRRTGATKKTSSARKP